jgi:hypothetical protein
MFTQIPKSVGDFEEPIGIGYRASQSKGCAQTGSVHAKAIEELMLDTSMGT